ncbi:hypothetical protein [Bosea sp. RAC05]|uniref:hypothetical protein n=1 Tax=Bosea sp. RAC05 TaxID=1842539 RepID=UPI00083CFB74|nr:hypothetical protein [Bosea sp. RAC05]AOG03019.1 hypothetical protein BSY19_5334 [Bosea sp. RAC05]
MHNRYFKVIKPFRIWRSIGISPSNAYVGSSRMLTTVKEARNALPGDEIHALVGGEFLVRGNECWPIGLSPPKESPFEKSYGLYRPAEMLAQDVKHVEAMPKPASAPDYGLANQQVSNNLLREFHPQVIQVEASPDLEKLREIVADVRDEIGAELTLKEKDITAYSGATITFELEGKKASLMISGAGMIIAELPEDMPSAVAPFESCLSGRGRIYLRDAVASETMAAELIREFVAAIHGPAARP